VNKPLVTSASSTHCHHPARCGGLIAHSNAAAAAAAARKHPALMASRNAHNRQRQKSRSTLKRYSVYNIWSRNIPKTRKIKQSYIKCRLQAAAITTSRDQLKNMTQTDNKKLF